MTTTLIDDHRTAIAELCRKYGVRRLDVFGSVLRDDFDPERSDVDFLYEWDGATDRNRFHDLMDLKEELASLLGRPVDLVSATYIRNPYFKAAVEATREPVYGP